MSDVFQLIHQKYGSDVEIVQNREGDTVTTTASIIAKGNARRVGLYMINLGTDMMYILPQRIPTNSNGIPLSALGGKVEVHQGEDDLLPALEWQALAQSADLPILVIEVLLE